MAQRPTAAERFERYVDRDGPVSLYRGAPGPCHLWTGGARSKRPHDAGQFGEFYGTFRIDGRIARAHRYAYEQAHGPVPDGLEVDHRCRRRNCVNAAHLEAVDHRTNTLRSTGPTAANSAKTHCPAGHPYDAANTYVNRGSRTCRTCARASNKARRNATREQQLAPVAHLTRTTDTHLERAA
ncbi:HNH endonuclease signature motif containing protein [Streptomyces sp. BH097]|uniref:HNH endonuclease signature motif containing protein n=1 Tax=Streptomyces sp. BH097 TaxID=3410406 RepID=UPI003CF87101